MKKINRRFTKDDVEVYVIRESYGIYSASIIAAFDVPVVTEYALDGRPVMNGHSSRQQVKLFTKSNNRQVCKLEAYLWDYRTFTWNLFLSMDELANKTEQIDLNLPEEEGFRKHFGCSTDIQMSEINKDNLLYLADVVSDTLVKMF